MLNWLKKGRRSGDGAEEKQEDEQMSREIAKVLDVSGEDSAYNRLRIIASYSPMAVSLPAVLGKYSNVDRFKATRTRFFGTAVLADISGFTKLTETLAQGSHATQKRSTSKKKKHTSATMMQQTGANTLATIINKIFSRLITIIRKYGGDVIAFAGDALLAVWRANGDEESDHNDCCLVAAQAALEMQIAMENFTTQGVTLKLHSGLSAGWLNEFHFGGYGNRWEYIIAGEPITEMGLSVENSVSGQAVIHQSMWDRIKDKCSGKEVHPGFWWVKKCNVPGKDFPDVVTEVMNVSDTPHRKECETILAGYVPRPVMSALKAGKYSLLGELRQVSILFINLPGFAYDTDEQAAANQEAFVEIQKALAKYDGSLRQLIQDDKGTVAIAAFGLPYSSHEDDPLRATMTALMVARSFKRINMKVAIGVTTGGAYCGCVGNEVRCEYAIVGDCVNLSARLMGQSMKKKITVLVDKDTHAYCTKVAKAALIDFQAMGEVQVKGKAKKVKIFRPRYSSRVQDVGECLTPIRGRESEMEDLLTRMLRVEATRTSSTTVLVGEAGSGKSKMIEGLVSTFRSKYGRGVMYGTGNSVDSTLMMSTWKNIVPTILEAISGVDLSLERRPSQSSDSEEQTGGDVPHSPHEGGDNEEKMSASTDDDDADVMLIPLHSRKCHRLHERMMNLTQLNILQKTELSLLNPYLHTQWEDSDEVMMMSQRQRMVRTSSIIVNLLKYMGKLHYPRLLVVEDLHSVDPHSWFVLQEAVEHLTTDYLFVFTTRAGIRLPRFTSLFSLPSVQVRQLPGLSAEAVKEFACDLLGKSDIPSRMHKALYRLSDGNPLFVKEIITYASQQVDSVMALEAASKPPPKPIMETPALKKLKKGATISRIEVDDNGDTVPEEEPEKEVGRLERMEHLVMVTPSMQQIMTSRIDLLLPEYQEILKIGSVIGTSFDVELLRAVVPQEYNTTSCINDGLTELESQGILKVTAWDPHDPAVPTRVKFTHTAMQDVSYKVLSVNDRCSTHARLAAFIEKKSCSILLDQNGDDIAAKISLAYTLGRHFEAGGLTLRATYYFYKAAQMSVLVDATLDAETYLTKAIELALDDAVEKEEEEESAGEEKDSESKQVENRYATLSLSIASVLEWVRQLSWLNFINGHHEKAFLTMKTVFEALRVKTPLDDGYVLMVYLFISSLFLM